MDKTISKKDTQTLLLNLFIELQEQCAAAEVQYYAVAGTLLGSVRHGGFIPWDDDIDVVIMRKDYDCLISHLEKNLGEGYCVVTRENSPLYYQEYPKLCYKNRNGVVSEISLDIFVYDSTDINKRFLRSVQNKALSALYAVKRSKVQKLQKMPLSINNRLARAAVYIAASCLSFGLIEKLFNKTITAGGEENSEYITNWGSHYHYQKATFKRSVFGRAKTLLFEGLEMNVPQDYMAFLIQTYGKGYMELPPENKRIGHSVSGVGCEDIDIEKARQRIERQRLKIKENSNG